MHFVVETIRINYVNDLGESYDLDTSGTVHFRRL